MANWDLEWISGVKISIIFGLLVGTVLILMWLAVIIHVWKGSRNRWLLKVSSLLLISNIGMVCLNAFTIPVVRDTDNNGWTNLRLWGVEISNSLLFYLPFNVSHLMLAYYYLEFSKGPVRRQRKPKSTCEKLTYMFLMAANVISPLIQCFAGYIYRSSTNPTTFEKLLLDFGWIAVGECAITSGVILVYSVQKLKI